MDERKEFLDAEAEFKRLQEEVAMLKENNVVSSMNVTFEERLNYVKRLQAIPKEFDKLLENESLKGDNQSVIDLREQIVSVRDDVLDYVKNQINQVVANQMSKLDNIERSAQRLFNELQHDFTELHDITEELNGLVAEFEEFRRDLPALRELVAEEMNINPYSVTEKQLKDRTAILAGFLREIKRKQIENYNNMVRILNDNVEALRLETGLSNELVERIGLLEVLSFCTFPTRLAYNTVSYLKEMDYAKLIEMMKLSNSIRKDINQLPERGKGGEPAPGGDDEPSIDTTLEAKLRNIEDSVYDLNDKYTLDIDDETKKQYDEKISDLEKNIADFRLNLEENKEKLSEEKYKDLNDRVNAMENLLGVIKERTNKDKKEETNGYMLFKQSVEFLRNRVEYEVGHLLGSRFTDNKIPQVVFDHFMDRLNGFEIEIEALRKDIKERFDNGGLDKTQFDNLMEMLDEVSKKVVEGNDKVESFEILKEKGFMDFLNGDIDSLEQAIEVYGQGIDASPAPIGKVTRKILDAMNKKLMNEIARIENNLEHMKDKEPEKYEAEMNRLNACKEKLESYNKKYRSKCPFMVKAWRSAKNWCKKHPKITMIAAGLAAVALTHMIVGPVLIPAIMHGNILIANKVAFLRPVLLGINNLLGGAINASIVNTSINGMSINVWRLANGLMISPKVTSAALLKGIAMVAGSSALIAAPIVAARKLFGKMEKKNKEKDKTPVEKEEKPKVTDRIKGAVTELPKKVMPKKKATLAMLKEYVTLATPEEKAQYFSKLTAEQKKELTEIIDLIENQTKEEEKSEGRGR